MINKNPPLRSKVYNRYPISSLVIYIGTTILHFLISGLGIIIGYTFLCSCPINYVMGLIYLMFAFGQMYLIMPYVVCPNCVYYKMKCSLCTSGLNVISKKIAKEGDIKNFSKRANGLFSHNKLYMGSLIGPIFVMIPALIFNFSIVLLVLFLSVIGLLMIRFFIIFKKTACVHCSAKFRCPNAKAMGIINKLDDA